MLNKYFFVYYAYLKELVKPNLRQWPTWCTIFSTFITILYMYMFRAISCSSSVGQIVLIQHLVSSLSVSSNLFFANRHSPATLTEVFPCFFLSCKANARV